MEKDTIKIPMKIIGIGENSNNKRTMGEVRRRIFILEKIQKIMIGLLLLLLISTIMIFFLIEYKITETHYLNYFIYILVIYIFSAPYLFFWIRRKKSFSIPVNWKIAYYIDNIFNSVNRRDIKERIQAVKERQKIKNNVEELKGIFEDIINDLENTNDIILFSRWKIEYLKYISQILTSIEKFDGWNSAEQNNISGFLKSLIDSSTSPLINYQYDQNYMNLIKEMAEKVEIVEEKKNWILIIMDIPKRILEFLSKRTMLSSTITVAIIYPIIFIIVLSLLNYFNPPSSGKFFDSENLFYGIGFTFSFLIASATIQMARKRS